MGRIAIGHIGNDRNRVPGRVDIDLVRIRTCKGHQVVASVTPVVVAVRG